MTYILALLPGADAVVRGLWPGTAAIVFHPRALRTDHAVVHGRDVGLEELGGLNVWGGLIPIREMNPCASPAEGLFWQVLLHPAVKCISNAKP
jgi:hypothetical protein